MKHILSILVIAPLAAGLGCSPTTPPVAREDTPQRVYAPATSAALAFDLPAAVYGPLPSFDRQGRSPEAFAGYEDAVTTFSYVHQRDEQRSLSPYGDLHRDAYTDRVSTTTR